MKIKPWHVYHEYHDFDIFSKCGKYRACFTFDENEKQWSDIIYLNPDSGMELNKVPKGFKNKASQYRKTCIDKYNP